MNQPEESHSFAYWPLGGGLLAMSLATLLGCFSGHEPETVIVRSLAAGCTVSLAATGIRSLWILSGPSRGQFTEP